MRNWTAEFGNIDRLLNTLATEDLASLCSLRATIRDRIADSGNVDCLPNAHAAEALMSQLLSMSAVMREWMVDSGNADFPPNANAAEAPTS